MTRSPAERARQRKYRRDLAGMHAGGQVMFVSTLIFPNTPLPQALAADLIGTRITEMFLSFIRNVKTLPPDEKPACVTCETVTGFETTETLAAVFCIVSPNKKARNGMACGVCHSCAQRFGTAEAIERACLGVVRENIWPHLRIIEEANFSTETGRA